MYGEVCWSAIVCYRAPRGDGMDQQKSAEAIVVAETGAMKG